MLKALMRVRLAAIGNWLSGGGRGKRGGKAGYAVLMGLVAVMLAFMMFTWFRMIAEPFHAAGVGFLYFIFFILVAFVLMLVGSIFTAKAQLFEAKDNALMLSLPVPPRDILLSRIASLVVLNYIYEAVVAIPVGICWVISCPVTVIGAAAFLLTCLCLPLMATAAAALFGWLISLLTARVRNKSLMTTVFSLAFLVLYFIGYQKLIQQVGMLAENGPALAVKLRAVWPLYVMGAAIANGDLLYLLLSLLMMLAPFALAYWLLSVSFIRTVTAQHGTARVEYREKRVSGRSVSSALFRRELARFLSSAVYMVNAGLGIFGAVAVAVLAAIKWNDLQPVLEMLGLAPSAVAGVLAIALCVLSSMTTISASTISMEGRNLWIARSLPVPAWAVLRAKLQLHLRLMMPAMLVPTAVLLVLLRPALPDALCLLAVPQIFTAFLAVAGLVLNLKMPHLDWPNETAAVKNNLSVLILLFGGWVLAAVPLLFLRFGMTPVMAAYGAVLLALTLLLRRWLQTRGARIFERL